MTLQAKMLKGAFLPTCIVFFHEAESASKCQLATLQFDYNLHKQQVLLRTPHSLTKL